MIDEKEKQRRKMLRLRDKYRSTICAGCRHNYYNFKNEGNGWDAPTSGEGCWHLESIWRGKCPQKS